MNNKTLQFISCQKYLHLILLNIYILSGADSDDTATDTVENVLAMNNLANELEDSDDSDFIPKPRTFLRRKAKEPQDEKKKKRTPDNKKKRAVTGEEVKERQISKLAPSQLR